MAQANSAIRGLSIAAARGVNSRLTRRRILVWTGGSTISIMAWSPSAASWSGSGSANMMVGDEENISGFRPTARTSRYRVRAQKPGPSGSW